MASLREEWKGRVEMQTVPFYGIDQYGTRSGEAIVDLTLEHGAVALGGRPRMSADLPAQLDRLMAIAW